MHPREWPLWVRALLGGLVWGAAMYAVAADEPRTVAEAVIYLVGGAVFGLMMWVVTRAQERRLVGPLTDADRASVAEAVWTARPPAEARLGEAAERLAWRWAHPRMRPVHQIVLFGLFVLLSVYLGISGTRWAWAGVVFWPAAAWLSIRMETRRQRVGERYLRAVAGASAP